MERQKEAELEMIERRIRLRCRHYDSRRRVAAHEHIGNNRSKCRFCYDEWDSENDIIKVYEPRLHDLYLIKDPSKEDLEEIKTLEKIVQKDYYKDYTEVMELLENLKSL